jgi:hypothetical protein
MNTPRHPARAACRRAARTIAAASTLAFALPPAPAATTLPAQELRGWMVTDRLLSSQIQIGPVVVYNMNPVQRSYAALSCGAIGPGGHYDCFRSDPFPIGPGKLCRLDTRLYPGDIWRGNGEPLDPAVTINYLEDQTDGQIGAFNGNWTSGNDNVNSCANEGMARCAGARWGAWKVGLMAQDAVGKTDRRPGSGMDAGVEYWVENAWDTGTAIYYSNAWVQTPIALIMTNGSLDGSDFNMRDSPGLPTLQQVFEAPLCSAELPAPRS